MRYLHKKRPQFSIQMPPTKNRTCEFINTYSVSGIVEKIGILGIPTQFVDGRCKVVSKFPSKSIALFALFMNTSLQFFIPLLLILIFYAHVLITVRKKSRQVVPMSTQNQANSAQIQINQTENKMSQVAKNVTKTLMIVTLFFVVCWSPSSIYFILAVEGSFGLKLASPFYNFSSYVVYINQIINPILYTLQYKDFQAQAAKIFLRGPCRRKRNGNADGNSSVNTYSTA